MATVILFNAARQQEIEDGTVTSGLVDVDGHLILTTRGGTDIDAGYVVGPPADDTPPASETVAGIAQIADDTEAAAGTDDEKIMTPQKVKSVVDAALDDAINDASETVKGIAEVADNAETSAGTSDSKMITPLKLRTFAVPYTGVVDPYWTYGKPDVTLDDGSSTVVSAFMAPNAGDIQPGQSVILERIGSTWYIVAAARDTVDYPKWVPLTLQNSWTHYAQTANFGTIGEAFNYSKPMVTRTSVGYVELKGLLQRASGAAAGSVILNIPAPFRPLVVHRFVLWSSGSIAAVEVGTNGDVTLLNASGTDLCLDGIRYNNDAALSWTAITYAAGFSNAPSAPAVAFAKDTYGRVFMRGRTRGTAATGNITTAIPAGMQQPAALGGSIGYGLLGTSTINRIDAPVTANDTTISDMYAGSANTDLEMGQLSWLADGFTVHPDFSASQSFQSVGYNVFTLATGSDYGSGYSGHRYTMLPDRTVKMDGLVATISVGAIIGYVPVGMRPKTIRQFVVEAADTIAAVWVTPSGQMIYAAGPTTWVSLATIMYVAEQ